MGAESDHEEHCGSRTYMLKLMEPSVGEKAVNTGDSVKGRI